MLKAQTYEYMKDSGEGWIGEIPEDWDVRRLASFGSFSKGGGFSKADLTDSGVSAVLYGDIYTKYNYAIESIERNISPIIANNSVKIYRGNLLFTGSGETKEDIGKCVVFNSNAEAVAGGDIIIFQQKSNNELFLSYCLNTHGLIEEKAKASKGEIIVHTYASKLRNLYIPIPPLPEQKAIADFLDRKTSQIDAAVAIKEEQIALLKERKPILIQKAVTQGLNPNAPMRDSGVEWIGKIPKHWELRRSKFIFGQRKELAKKGDVQLSATQAYGVIPQALYEERTGYRVVKLQFHLEKRKHVEVDDFVISMRSFQGGLERAWSQGCIRSSYIVLQPLEEVEASYFSRLFKSPRYISALQATANFIRDGQDLNFTNYSLVDLLLPPLSEQKEIAQMIEKESAKIDQAIDLNQQQIEKLKEYKATLINSAVTGKIKVMDQNSEGEP